MDFSASIEWPAADVSALWRQIERAQRDLGKGLGRALLVAMKSITATLGTSTKVSAEYRPYRAIRKTKKGDKTIYEIDTYRGKHNYKGKFKQRFSRNGPLRKSVVFAKTEDQLRTFPSVKIKFRGLAKKSWKAYRGTGIGGGLGDPVMRAASRHMFFEGRFKGDDPYAILTNRLDYIEDALNGGEQPISTAMDRAARAMEHTIDNQIVKKMGAA